MVTREGIINFEAFNLVRYWKDSLSPNFEEATVRKCPGLELGSSASTHYCF